MPIYNNSALGQSFENVAAMFAPPPAGDLVNYAQAAALRQKQGIIEQLKSDPRYKGADAGVLAGLFAPTQSFYAQDQNNATAQRGQDIAAQTSVANNTLDNQTKLALPRFSPLSPGEVLPAVQGNLASQFGLPGDLGAVAGPVKPLTDAEARGAIIQNNPKPLTPEEITALTMGSTPTQNVVGPDGKPVVSYNTGAVGKEPYINKGAEAKGDLYNYVAPDGTEGAAIFDGTNIVDAITKQPLPENIKVYKASAQGTTDQIGMGTNSNRTDAQRLRAAVGNANALVNDLEGIIKANPAATGLAGDAVSFLQDTGQVVKEIAATLAKNPESPITPDEFRVVTDQLDKATGGSYNPAYRQARALILELAYSNASMNNPSGEVSMQALSREVDALGQGLMGNDQGLLGVIDVARGRMRRKLQQADVLDGSAKPLTPDQVGSGPADAAPAQPQTEAEYNALPSGALFVDPDDGKTYRKP